MSGLAPGERRTVRLHIHGDRGPGRTCGPHADVGVGVQVGKEWVGTVPGDVDAFDHTVEIEAVGHTDGLRWRGAAVHGPTADRFVYLAWTCRGAGGEREMFRRAKLRLRTIPAEVLAAALDTGRLQARLELTLPDGNPVCATPKSLVWSAPETQ